MPSHVALKTVLSTLTFTQLAFAGALQARTYTSESGQYGYNGCDASTAGPNSLCQTVNLNSLNDFCLWGGGELDPHGADGNGNPIGALVYVNGVQIHEWTSFMSDTEFCFRACWDGANAWEICNHIYDLQGCQWNMPGDYNTGFSVCQGDDGQIPGVYVTNGVTSTYFQGTDENHPSPAPPAHPAPATSNCQYPASINAAVQTYAAPTTTTSTSSTTYTSASSGSTPSAGAGSSNGAGSSFTTSTTTSTTTTVASSSSSATSASSSRPASVSTVSTVVTQQQAAASSSSKSAVSASASAKSGAQRHGGVAGTVVVASLLVGVAGGFVFWA
ncbi:hypothetical protein T439DRAFT_329458 [Meredithblackwellia eburnea MCA 4105]